jgi:hypothetical protein
MVQNLYISPKHKHLITFAEWHLFYKLANFFGEVLVPTDRRSEAVCLYHALCILVAAATIECKVLENINSTKEE